MKYNFSYEKIMDEQMQGVFYKCYAHKKRRVYCMVTFIVWVNLVVPTYFIFSQNGYNVRDILVYGAAYMLLIMTTLIMIFWKKYYLYVENKLVFSRFKDSDSIVISIEESGLMMSANGRLYTLTTSMNLKNKKIVDSLFLVKIVETENYIFITSTGYSYLVYLDKRNMNADEISYIQAILQKEFKRKYKRMNY